MRYRSLVFGAVAAAGVALSPAKARAITPPQCTYVFTLGLGGNINGCYTGFLTQLGEDAGYVSNQYYWAGNFGAPSGSTNAPSPAGTLMFDDDCGSPGYGTFAFCNAANGNAKPTTTINSLGGELVLGLNVPDPTYGSGFYWVYSGLNTRNGTPPPAGFQAVLLQLTLGGVDQAGQFLFGWEDLNTGCVSRVVTNNNRFRIEDLNNGPMLDMQLGTCNSIAPGGNSDSDFNDSYMQFDIRGTGIPNDVVPEPVTMSLVAMGLIAMSGASLRRRKKQG